jgi:hypothetical protein
MVDRGIYKIKDQFFEDFPDENLKDNKGENRPCYFCFRDTKTDLLWMIPMSNQIEKYKRIVDDRQKKNKPCDIIHVAKLDNGKESAFLIQDIFPILEKYILSEYTFNGNLLRISSDALADTIEHKAKTILVLIRKGVKLLNTQADVLKIEQELLSFQANKTNNGSPENS